MWNLKSLFHKHAQEIQRFLQKRGHGPDVAADLTQDVFLRILGSSTPKRDDNPRAYLHKVAHNISVDLYRRERTASLEYLSEEEYCALPDSAADPERVISDQQQLAVTALPCLLVLLRLRSLKRNSRRRIIASKPRSPGSYSAGWSVKDKLCRRERLLPLWRR